MGPEGRSQSQSTSATTSTSSALKQLEEEAGEVVVTIHKCVEILRTVEEFSSLKPSTLWSAVKGKENATAIGTSVVPLVNLWDRMKERGLLKSVEALQAEATKIIIDKPAHGDNPRRQVSLRVLMPLASALTNCYAQLDQIPIPAKTVSTTTNKTKPKKQPPAPPGMLSLQNYTDIGAFLEFAVCTSILPFLEANILFSVQDGARYFLPKSLAGRISRPSLLWGCSMEQHYHQQQQQQQSDRGEAIFELKIAVLTLGNLLLLDRFRPMLLPRHLADLYAAIFQVEAYTTNLQTKVEEFPLEQQYQELVTQLLPVFDNHHISPKQSITLDPAQQAQSLQALLLQGTKSPLWLRQRVSQQLTEMASHNLPVILQVFVHAAPPKDKTAASLRLAKTLLTGRQQTQTQKACCTRARTAQRASGGVQVRRVADGHSRLAGGSSSFSRPRSRLGCRRVAGASAAAAPRCTYSAHSSATSGPSSVAPTARSTAVCSRCTGWVPASQALTTGRAR